MPNSHLNQINKCYTIMPKGQMVSNHLCEPRWYLPDGHLNSSSPIAPFHIPFLNTNIHTDLMHVRSSRNEFYIIVLNILEDINELQNQHEFLYTKVGLSMDFHKTIK